MKALLPGLLLLLPAATWPRVDRRLSVPLRVNGLTIPYSVFAVFVMPGSNIRLEFVDSAHGPIVHVDTRGTRARW
jgi:hypothetical protein